MKTKNIYRGPIGNQDRFLIVMVNKRKKQLRRLLEFCKEMNCNLINFENISATDEYDSAVACEEVALMGMFRNEKLTDTFRYATNRETIIETSKMERVSIEKHTTPEELRWRVFRALLQGKLGITYYDVEHKCIGMDGRKGPYYHYVKDMNYRVGEIGRTLMALTNRAVYGMTAILGSKILSDQPLPYGCSIGEFVDAEGNSYLMIQNTNYADKEKKAFSLQLKKKFRVYRVNPHTGKQVVVKDSIDTFNVLVMPGDADLLRFQDAEEEAYAIEYVFKK